MPDLQPINILMIDKIQNLISILVREEELFREFSRLLASNCDGADKAEITSEMADRLENLSMFALGLESLTQNLTDICPNSVGPASRKSIGQLIDKTTSQALSNLANLGEIINRSNYKAQERSKQTEQLIDKSSQILSETSVSIGNNLMSIRHIPKGELVC